MFLGLLPRHIIIYFLYGSLGVVHFALLLFLLFIFVLVNLLFLFLFLSLSHYLFLSLSHYLFLSHFVVVIMLNLWDFFRLISVKLVFLFFLSLGLRITLAFVRYFCDRFLLGLLLINYGNLALAHQQ